LTNAVGRERTGGSSWAAAGPLPEWTAPGHCSADGVAGRLPGGTAHGGGPRPKAVRNSVTWDSPPWCKAGGGSKGGEYRKQLNIG